MTNKMNTQSIIKTVNQILTTWSQMNHFQFVLFEFILNLKLLNLIVTIHQSFFVNVSTQFA